MSDEQYEAGEEYLDMCELDRADLENMVGGQLTTGVMALAYTLAVPPSTIWESLFIELAPTFAGLEQTWDRVQARTASCLERRAHGQAA